MYDMYPWDSANQGEYPPRPLRSVKNSRQAAKATSTATATATATASAAARRDFSPAQAVQFALDRRDNGGEADQAATLPAASQGRQ
jgi:hypothetical protein